MTTSPWHEFLDGRSGVLHIDRPTTPAVDPATATYAVLISGAVSGITGAVVGRLLTPPPSGTMPPSTPRVVGSITHSFSIREALPLTDKLSIKVIRKGTPDAV